jgi:hypothetical protein
VLKGVVRVEEQRRGQMEGEESVVVVRHLPRALHPPPSSYLM